MKKCPVGQLKVTVNIHATVSLNHMKKIVFKSHQQQLYKSYVDLGSFTRLMHDMVPVA